MAISRLFTEISSKVDQLNTSLTRSMETAEKAGLRVEASGRRMLQSFEKALNPTALLSDKLTLLEKSGKSTGDIMKVMGDQIYSATKRAQEMGVPVDSLVQKYTSLDVKMRLVGERMQSFGSGLRTVGLQASVALTAPIVGAGAAIVKFGSDFESAMTQSTAIMQNLSEELQQSLEKTALEVSKTTTFTAAETAASYYYLASAGLDAAQSIKALPQVARFAQAGMFDMSLATDLLTDAQSALGLTVKDATANLENMSRVSDVLVKANTLANASVQQFSEALTNKAGASLRVLGKDVEEGVAVLAAFADQGVKSAEAGTQLSIVLRDMQKAAIENADKFKELGIAVYTPQGDMRNVASILADMERAMGGLSDQGKKATLQVLGFSEKSVQAQLTLLGTSEKIRQYEEQLRKAGGTTQDVADKQLTSFSATMDLLRSRVEAASIEMFESLQPVIVNKIIPALESAIEFLERMVDAFTQLPEGIQAVALAGAGVTAAFGPMAFAIGSVANAVGGLSSALGVAGGAGLIGRLGTLAKVGGTVSLVFAGLYAAKEGLEYLGKTEYFRTKIGSGPETDRTADQIQLQRDAEALYEKAKALGVVDEAYERQKEKYKDLIDAGKLVLQDPLEKATADSWSSYFDRLSRIVDEWTAKHQQQVEEVVAPKDDAEEVTKKAISNRYGTLEQEMAAIQRDLDAKFQEMLTGFETDGTLPLFEYTDLLPPPEDDLPEWLVKLGEDFKKAQTPMTELVKEFNTLNIVGIENSDILQQNAKRIIDAAEAQQKYGGILSESEQQWYDAAKALEEYNQRLGMTERQLTDLYLQQTRMRLEQGKGGFGDIAITALGDYIADYENIATGLSDSFGDFFTTMSDGFARALVDTKNLGSALADVGKDAIGGLISSLIRLGIQWLVNKAIVSSIGKGLLGEQAAQAGATAAAWAPAAALVSLATLGANATPAAVALTTTSAVSAAIAALSQIGKFEAGGFIPGGKQVIQVNEQGPEFIMNARATREFMPLLKALNAGGRPEAYAETPGLDLSGTGNINIQISNYGVSKDFEVERLDPSTVRIIARDEARKVLSSDGPGVIAEDLAYPNSRTSKAMSRHTTTRRIDR